MRTRTRWRSWSLVTSPLRSSNLRWWPDAVFIGLGALILRLPSMFAPTQLGYDDGGYGLAAVAMRQGFAPFREIFSPQGPLFLPLIRVADVVGLEHRNAPRLLSVLAGAVCAIAVYAIAAQLMDRNRAILAGALTAGSGVLLWTTGPLTGDGPAAAFATSAVAVAVAYRRSPSLMRALTVTLLAGCALSTKSLLVGPALLIAWVLVANRRRVLDALLVPVGALAIVIAFALPWGIDHVLDDYVRYHLDKTADRQPLANLEKLANAYLRRDTFLTALAALGLVTAVVAALRRRGSPGRPVSRRPESGPSGGLRFLWWWTGLVVVVLLAQDPMFRNHLSALVAPAALLVARFRPSWRLVAVAGLVAIPFQAITLRPLLAPRDYRGETARVVAELRGLPADAWALSDDPGLVWRAGRGTDPFFVDPSVLRLDSQVQAIKINEARIVRSAAQARMCAVVITSPERFGRYPNLPDHLARVGYRRTIALGGSDDADDRLGLYVRDECRA